MRRGAAPSPRTGWTCPRYRRSRGASPPGPRPRAAGGRSRASTDLALGLPPGLDAPIRRRGAMRVSVIQMNQGSEKQANLDQARRLIEAAVAADRPGLVSLPETWTNL